MSDDIDDQDELRLLKRLSTLKAYRIGLEMLDSSATPATARASVVRAFLAADALRVIDDGTLEPHEMTPAQLDAAMRDLNKILARRRAEDAVLIEEKQETSVFE